MRASPTARRIVDILDDLGGGVLRLAYHAAVPVVVDATLVNLLRVNFFLDPPDSLAYEAEAGLLLSPLFREIGEGLFEIEPGIRNLLLTGLYSRYGADRVRRVALLLEQYTDATPAWRSLPELERAQQLTAVSFLDPIRAEQWLERNAFGASSEDLDREWYVAMSRHIADSSSVITADQRISDALARIEHEGIGVRLEAIQSLDALARLPEADPARVVSALCGFINTRAAATQGPTEPVSPDVQAALSLIGSLPHSNFELERITLNGADLAGLDFSEARFTEIQLIGVNANKVNLNDAHFTGKIHNSVMNGASLNGARLMFDELDHVSLVGASLVNARLTALRVQAVDLSGADLHGARVNFTETHGLIMADIPDITNEAIDDVAEVASPSPQRVPEVSPEAATEAQLPAAGVSQSSEKSTSPTAVAPVRVTPPDPQGQVKPGIAMLGAPGSGKTTFIAALQVALLRQPGLGWSLRPEDEASARSLVALTDDLVSQHRFPPAANNTEEYHWSLEGVLPNAVRERSGLRFRRRDLHVRMPLHSRDTSARDVDTFLGSAGIMFFFDPVGEFERGGNFRHAYGLLTQLRRWAQHSNRLPHHVAVCITKFDEIPVLETAKKLRVVELSPEPPEFPYVPDEYAQEFFETMCRISRSDDAELILPLLQQTFRSERIRFFVTSAIGFYFDPSVGVFDPDDYQNHIRGNQNRIRGGIYPINVAEPMLWLARNVANTPVE